MGFTFYLRILVRAILTQSLHGELSLYLWMQNLNVSGPTGSFESSAEMHSYFIRCTYPSKPIFVVVCPLPTPPHTLSRQWRNSSYKTLLQKKVNLAPGRNNKKKRIVLEQVFNFRNNRVGNQPIRKNVRSLTCWLPNLSAKLEEDRNQNMFTHLVPFYVVWVQERPAFRFSANRNAP